MPRVLAASYICDARAMQGRQPTRDTAAPPHAHFSPCVLHNVMVIAVRDYAT